MIRAQCISKSARRIFAGLFAAWLSVVQAPAQGRLAGFEKGAGGPPRIAHSGSSGSAGYVIAEILWEACFFALVYGGISSWNRMAGDSVDDGLFVPRRVSGEPLLSIARLDAAFQKISADIDAVDLRAEAGYGPFAGHVNYTRYLERNPDDSLDLIRAFGLYRMSFGHYVEAGVGLGVLTLRGSGSTSQTLLAFHCLVRPIRHFGIEFRPAWSQGVEDYDAAFLCHLGHASLKLGYRWVSSPKETLDGPYAGISMRW